MFIKNLTCIRFLFVIYLTCSIIYEFFIQSDNHPKRLTCSYFLKKVIIYEFIYKKMFLFMHTFCSRFYSATLYNLFPISKRKVVQVGNVDMTPNFVLIIAYMLIVRKKKKSWQSARNWVLSHLSSSQIMDPFLIIKRNARFIPSTFLEHLLYIRVMENHTIDSK